MIRALFITFLFVVSIAHAQYCPPPQFLRTMEQLTTNRPNCFCTATFMVPNYVNPPADLIHLSYLVGEGPFANMYRPSRIHCTRGYSNYGGQNCFNNGSQRCLMSRLSLSTNNCPENPSRGSFNYGFQGLPNYGGNNGFPNHNGNNNPGYHGGFPSPSPAPDDRRR